MAFNMAYSHRGARTAGAALALGLVWGVVWTGASRLAERSNDISPAIRLLAEDQHCDPGVTVCTARGEALSMALRLGDDIRPLERFPAEVTLDGPAVTEIDSVSLRFAMAGMDMGVNRFDLRPRGTGVWQGQALLPICSTGRQDWGITVEVRGSRRYEVEFSVVFKR